MFGLSGRLLIEMAALTLLGGLRGARIRMRDEREMRDCALAAAAMVQAAGYARDGLPDVARARLVTVILRLNAGSVEYALGGRETLESGLRSFLVLAALDVADHTQAPLLDAVHHYVRWARRLRRRRRTQGELFDELRRIEVLDVSRRYAELVLFARHLLPVSMGRDPIADDAALVWLYGLRAAWLWCEAGGGRSPFGFVPRALIAAVHALLGLSTPDRQG